MFVQLNKVIFKRPDMEEIGVNKIHTIRSEQKKFSVNKFLNNLANDLYNSYFGINKLLVKYLNIFLTF